MAELVGGAFLSSFLNVLFDRMASRPFVDFISGKKSTSGLLEKLKIKLLLIDKVLDDAEEKQIRRPRVRKWLDELKDVVYAAGELLDEINTEALRHKLEDDQSGDSSTSYHQVKNFISSSWFNKFDNTLECKIVDILGRLELILNEKAALGLEEGVQLRPQARLRETTSLVEETVVYGRDNEKEAVIALLLSDDATENKIGVIPIVGMGGIGKTTLAQLVYNNDKVKRNFDLRAWVCVSEEFDVLRITQEIYGSIMSENEVNFPLDRLQVKLKEVLTKKKFFIVLDDVWNQNYILWDDFKRPFEYGARGSKIIVTTRNSDIASMVRTLPPHHLMQIADEDCWSLFSKHAFENANVCRAHPNLEGIRKQIVRKCDGLPLAAKSLAGLLRSVNVKEWEKILKSDIWELSDKETKILPALWLSYHYLPSHLKRCFAYCSIFPKDFTFRRSDLVSLWIAEDLIQPTKQTTIEEVGEDYINNLISRSFFQPSKLYGELFATMHDLINDLAKFVSGEFCMRLEDNDKIGSKTRHFSYIQRRGHHDFAKFEALREAKYLHTFLPLKPPYWRTFCSLDQVIHDLLPMFQCLRMLNLSGYSISELPSSIGNLKHLRHLDLSLNQIKELPDSVCTLYNLRTLLLCDNYTLKQLPGKLGRLINLRHLDINRTGIRKMPPGMSKLKDLQYLSNFFLENRIGQSNIVELKELEHLHGKLFISGLDNIANAGDTLEANLKDKKYLDELVLKWRGDTEDSIKDREVLETLQPHANLKKLEILGYGGTRFPAWFGDHSLSNLVSVTLQGSRFCCFLPPLGQLPSLEELCIRGLNEVVSIGAEFYGSGIQPFRSLEVLDIEDMEELQEWSYVKGNNEEEGGLFPKLCELTLYNCPKLDAFPKEGFPSKLETLSFNCSRKLFASRGQWGLHSLESLRWLFIEFSEECGEDDQVDGYSFPEEGLLPTSLTTVQICNLPNRMTIQGKELRKLISLESLTISGCPDLQRLPEEVPSSLKCLSIHSCPKLGCLSEKWLHTSLSELFISECPLLAERVQRETGEDWLKVAHIPHIHVNRSRI